jgi:DNA-binding NarL/FixJ family response regulator
VTTAHERPSARHADQTGWILMPLSTLPDEWRDGAREMALVRVPVAHIVGVYGSAVGELSPLSAEDARLICLVAEGRSHLQIARELNRSLRTVERRLASLRRRYGARSGAELTALLVRQGL